MVSGRRRIEGGSTVRTGVGGGSVAVLLCKMPDRMCYIQYLHMCVSLVENAYVCTYVCVCYMFSVCVHA